jgi:broad specificity phosphatase PhoE
LVTHLSKDGEQRAPLLTIDLFRHGETERNAANLFSGCVETPLTPLGREQASRVRLATHYDLAFHSTLSRSRDTLLIALRHSRAEAILEDERIRERCVGALEGTPRYRPEPWKKGDIDWVPGGDGESYRVVTERCLSFLDDLAARAARPMTVVISTHAGVLRILDAILTGKRDRRAILDQDIPNCTPVRYTVDRIPRPAFV